MTNSISIYTTFNKSLFKITETTTPNIVEIDPVNIGPGVLTSILDQSVGVLKVGKNDFDNTKAGYILGLDNGVAKFYIGNSSNYFNWTGSVLNMSGSIIATDGTIGGWTIDSTTIFSATSGERIILDQGNKKIELLNSSNSSILKMNYGSALQAVLKISPTNDAKRGLEFVIASGLGADAKCITIDNPSTSISIDMTDAGSTGINIAGASAYGINISSHAGTNSALNIASNSNAASISVGGGDYPSIDITQNGASTNSFGIRIAQDSNALQDGIFIDNNANSSVSWGINIDRDGATSGGVVSAINIECVNTTDGTKATGINFTNSTIYSIFNVATDVTDPTGGGGAATGRIPILVGGVLKYLAYY